jgi:hypothetical protein
MVKPRTRRCDRIDYGCAEITTTSQQRQRGRHNAKAVRLRTYALQDGVQRRLRSRHSPSVQKRRSVLRTGRQQIFTESILERIYNQIAKADIIVSDMTGQNSNVFYETGYAHALGKCTILLTKRADDIPFDLKHAPHIVYGDSIAGLKSDLRARVKYFIDHPDKRQLADPQALEFYLKGTNIARNPHPNVIGVDHDPKLGWTISFDIHNPGDRAIDISGMKFGFVFPAGLGEPIYKGQEFVRLPGDEYMHKAQMMHLVLLPKDWFHVPIQVFNKTIAEFVRPTGGGPPIFTNFVYWCSIRTFTEMGMQEVKFAIFVK